MQSCVHQVWVHLVACEGENNERRLFRKVCEMFIMVVNFSFQDSLNSSRLRWSISFLPIARSSATLDYYFTVTEEAKGKKGNGITDGTTSVVAMDLGEYRDLSWRRKSFRMGLDVLDGHLIKYQLCNCLEGRNFL
jgi:hypothetical protein